MAERAEALVAKLEREAQEGITQLQQADARLASLQARVGELVEACELLLRHADEEWGVDMDAFQGVTDTEAALPAVRALLGGAQAATENEGDDMVGAAKQGQEVIDAIADMIEREARMRDLNRWEELLAEGIANGVRASIWHDGKLWMRDPRLNGPYELLPDTRKDQPAEGETKRSSDTPEHGQRESGADG